MNDPFYQNISLVKWKNDSSEAKHSTTRCQKCRRKKDFARVITCKKDFLLQIEDLITSFQNESVNCRPRRSLMLELKRVRQCDSDISNPKECDMGAKLILRGFLTEKCCHSLRHLSRHKKASIQQRWNESLHGMWRQRLDDNDDDCKRMVKSTFNELRKKQTGSFVSETLEAQIMKGRKRDFYE